MIAGFVRWFWDSPVGYGIRPVVAGLGRWLRDSAVGCEIRPLVAGFTRWTGFAPWSRDSPGERDLPCACGIRPVFAGFARCSRDSPGIRGIHRAVPEAWLYAAILCMQCEKIRRKRSAFLGSLRVAHTTSVDDTDHSISKARYDVTHIAAVIVWRHVPRTTAVIM